MDHLITNTILSVRIMFGKQKQMKEQSCIFVMTMTLIDDEGSLIRMSICLHLVTKSFADAWCLLNI